MYGQVYVRVYVIRKSEIGLFGSGVVKFSINSLTLNCHL